jgi:hypothetical protein
MYIFLGGLLVALAVIGALYVLLITHRIDYSFGML